MKIILALALLAACAGCVPTTPEERTFFREGWMHPEEAAEKRMNTSGW